MKKASKQELSTPAINDIIIQMAHRMSELHEQQREMMEQNLVLHSDLRNVCNLMQDMLKNERRASLKHRAQLMLETMAGEDSK